MDCSKISVGFIVISAGAEPATAWLGCKSSSPESMELQYFRWN